MSTLRANTIQNVAGTLPPAVTRGEFVAVRCYQAYSAGTPTVQDSFNVSSLTDTGTGDIATNLTSAMANSNYSGACTNATAASGAGPYALANSTSQIRTLTMNLASVATDYNLHILVVGDYS